MNKKNSLGLMLFCSISLVSANYMMGGSCGYGAMGFGGLIGTLVVAVLVLLVIWLSKQIWKK